jgi:hypothetical protein
MSLGILVSEVANRDKTTATQYHKDSIHLTVDMAVTVLEERKIIIIKSDVKPTTWKDILVNRNMLIEVREYKIVK